ncbi:retrovirus-related Pol polyprotein from transposon TNT 1-94 [Gossypium australe]|uniref:Retrovirus-related Pol polyprotein from transposon TNT 1-94 n=1 Tax=Gossypium australe TaxID=47621 RepID=A0A5B6WV41_9ROSI|nr:retrovirus-related Pol polyprotein from transposon TNT 1-94 [Gossypium australe]
MNDWLLFQMDLYNAFFRVICMKRFTWTFRRGEHKVCRLLKSLYGLKQTSRQWNLKLNEAILHGDKIVVLLVYVYDLLITGNDIGMIGRLKKVLHRSFKMKDLGELMYFLSIEIARSNKGMRKYALELISDAGFGEAKPASTPLAKNKRFTTAEYDDLVHLGGCNDELLLDVSAYQRLMGRLLYLTNTWPDISYAVQHLSQFMQKPKKSHYEATLQIVRYIKKSLGKGSFLAAENKAQLVAYCDSDWATCSMTRRSITGFCIKLGNSLSKKQSTVLRSSAEADYRSTASTVAEIVWLSGLLKDICFDQFDSALLFSDSQAALQIATNPTQHVRTDEQLADVMTKALGVQQHGYLMSKLEVKDLYHPPT